MSGSATGTDAADRAFMREAIELARGGMHAGEGGPFGSVVVLDGRVVGRGCNRVTSTLDPTAHAEVVAIRDACTTLGRFDLRGCVVYASCEPCPMCLAAILWSRADRLVYGATRLDAADAGFDDAAIYDQIGLPPEGRSLPTGHILGEDAVVVFDEWRAKTDRIPY